MTPLVSIERLQRRLQRRAGPARRRSRLHKGEALGLVGESGSGKSVTWLAALGLLPRACKVTGSVRARRPRDPRRAGRRARPGAGGRVAMIFQDPASALNPVLTIRKQLCEALALHRDLSGEAVKAEARRLLDLVGIPDAARRLVRLSARILRRPGPAHHDRDGAGRKSRSAGRGRADHRRSMPPSRRRSWSCSRRSAARWAWRWC